MTIADNVALRFQASQHQVAGVQKRPIHEIAREILQDWKPVNYAAKPYLEAMLQLDKVTDDYGQDPGSMVIAYFLGNARTWKGEKAKVIKKELQDMIKR